MKLITRDIAKRIPRLYSQDGKGYDAIAQVKFFTPDANWTWYVTEANIVKADGRELPLADWDPETWEPGDDVLFFGLVDGFEKELGYFVLSELLEVRGGLGLPIERDLHWDPKPLREVA